MIVSVLWNYYFKFPNLITNSLSTGMSLYWIGTKFCVIDICDTDICDKRNSGIYLMTDPSAQGYPPSLADGRTDRKISTTQETLHSCQSWNDQKPIGNHSPDFSVIAAFWRICWWARGGLREGGCPGPSRNNHSTRPTIPGTRGFWNDIRNVSQSKRIGLSR